MTFKRSSGGVWSGITTTLKRRASGAWVDIDTIRRKASGAWTEVWRRITLTTQDIVNSVGVGNPICGYRLNTSGIAESLKNTTYVTLETWLAAGASSGYECRATVTSGTLTTGATGSWLALSSSKEWTVQKVGVGTNSCIFTLEIRNASTLATLASTTIQITADRF